MKDNYKKPEMDRLLKDIRKTILKNRAKTVKVGNTVFKLK